MSSLIVDVCRVEAIHKHPNADKLSIANVKGWWCIVGLNQYEVGDLVVFIPPETLISTETIDKYKLTYIHKNRRLRTIKLRGFISQGLILPNDNNWKEGTNVADKLGITKYEPPEPRLHNPGFKPNSKKKNPHFSKYTNIENIKNFNTVFKPGDAVVITEKIHGTNFRAGILKRYEGNIWGKIKSWLFGEYEFVYGSHRVQLVATNQRKNFYKEDVYGYIAKKYNLAEILPKDCIVYGEIYGTCPSNKKPIQKGYTYGLTKDVDIVFFDVKLKGKYLSVGEFWEFCKTKNLPTAPNLYTGEFHDIVLDQQTQGESILDPNTKVREGCVVKSLIEENHFRIGRKILKSINPEYLLKENTVDH